MVRDNPAWSNKALSAVWPRLEKKVGRRLMPKQRRTRGSIRLLEEYGTGRYGVALPTHEPGVVLKVTTDLSEAIYAATACKRKRQPAGIVRYDRVYGIDGQHQGRSLYALWREEATYVGGVRYWASSRKKKTQWTEEVVFLEDTGETAQTLVRRLLGSRNKMGAFFAMAQRAYKKAMGVKAEKMRETYRRLDRRGTDAPTEIIVERILLGARLMQRGTVLAHVGDAILSSFRAGLFLSDVHEGNLGLVRRKGKEIIVITDPGRAIPVKKTIRVPKIVDV